MRHSSSRWGKTPGAEGPSDLRSRGHSHTHSIRSRWTTSTPGCGTPAASSFIDGENDPWGAEPFELGAKTLDSYGYLAPGVNHGYANIATLTESEQLEAANIVRRWAGLCRPGSACA
jgi:hypothetical protein